MTTTQVSGNNVKNVDVKIPDRVDLNNIYYPRFHLVDLISTRKPPFSSSSNRHPPRPPNAFFLMKNCYLLELKLQGYRLAMPDLCRQAKQIWREVPQDVKNRYDDLALQAQILHQSIYPNYRFTPKRRTTFKPWRGAESAFQSTECGGRSSSRSQSSSPSSPTGSTQSQQSPQLPQSPQSPQPSLQFEMPLAIQNDYNNINGDLSVYPFYNYYNYYGLSSESPIENGFNIINNEGLNLNMINNINNDNNYSDIDYSHYIDYNYSQYQSN